MGIIWEKIFDIDDWFHSQLIDYMTKEAFASFEKLALSQLDVIVTIRKFQVKNNQQGFSLKQLAEKLKISPSACSERVEILVSKGFLKRIQNPKDRRSIQITLSEQTAENFDNAKENLDKIESNLLNSFDHDEIKSMSKLLDRILEVTENNNFKIKA